MTALFLAAHNDDETLFGSFLIQECQPWVVVCLRSQVQEDRYGITAAARERETSEALLELGAPGWEQWPYLDRDPNWSEVRRELEELNGRSAYDPVFAPAVEPDGHYQHNRIGDIAYEVFGDRVISYLTYTRSGGRSRNGTEIEPKPEWIERKHRALACYRSQIEEPSCRPWFLGDLREYVL
jgi:LmbE family N-acetylglucosaminyl deacetylase